MQVRTSLKSDLGKWPRLVKGGPILVPVHREAGTISVKLISMESFLQQSKSHQKLSLQYLIEINYRYFDTFKT